MACWACAGAVEGSALICARCGKIQPSSARDYFSVFSLQPRLDLALPALEGEFYRLSRKLHPDRFAQASPQEREWSVANTALLNDAWRTLKDPLRRTEYLLDLCGVETCENSNASRAPADLLEEVFELNMQLEELRSNRDPGLLDAGLQSKLKLSKQKFEDLVVQADRDLHAQWNAWDEGDSGARASAEAAMTQLLARRRYVSNLLREVHRALGMELGTE